MKNEINHFLIALKRLYRTVLGFEEGTDIQGTIDGIKKDISFRGHSAWILIFSILIASIGLNVNSTAVVIGAMLISPLMGPILGIGLSVGTNDFETLVRSMKNVGVAIGISLITSTLYFLITPLEIEQSELLARTKPTLLDVLVALFGGFAGIIAGSRKEKNNVIPGVAIATALMPPLCTAGYGLATFKMHYFLGAFYLFFINSVFISLSTFLFVRYLKFPLIEFVSQQKLRRYKFLLISFLIITITPSAVIFYYVIQETRFTVGVEKFVSEKCKFEGTELISYKTSYSDSLSTIDLYFLGNEITAEKKFYLEDNLSDYGLMHRDWFPLTEKTVIKIHQKISEEINIDEKLSELNNNLRIKIIEDIYTKNEELVKSKEQKIELLEEELVRLTKAQSDTLPFSQLGKELLYHFPEIKKYSYAKAIEHNHNLDTTYYDTISVFMLNFDEKTKKKTRQEKLTNAEIWLEIRLGKDKIRTVEY